MNLGLNGEVDMVWRTEQAYPIFLDVTVVLQVFISQKYFCLSVHVYLIAC